MGFGRNRIQRNSGGITGFGVRQNNSKGRKVSPIFCVTIQVFFSTILVLSQLDKRLIFAKKGGFHPLLKLIFSLIFPKFTLGEY